MIATPHHPLRSVLIASTLAVAAWLISSCTKPYSNYKTSYLDDILSQQQIRRAEPVNETDLFPSAAALNVPAEAASINDVARFLAGLPALSGQDAMAHLRATPGWQSHRAHLDEMWLDFSQRHARPVSNWARNHAGDLRSAHAVLYPFSGPDFVFPYLIYPHAETYVMCGLEPCEPLPDWNSLNPTDVEQGLDGLNTSLTNILQYTYFITKDMRTNFQSTRFRGVLPVFMVFLARTGHVVESVNGVRLDPSGNPIILPAGQSSVQGLLIRVRGNDGPKRIFYFSQDLSDQALAVNGPFLRFASSLGQPAALLKSASYLMHETYFSHIRNHLLNHCSGIIQDPSGVPLRSFKERNWKLDLYGNYEATLPIFKQYEQPDLRAAYQDPAYHAQPIPFGIGYLVDPATTSLMVGKPR